MQISTLKAGLLAAMCGVSLGSVAEAAPSISIDGLNGAEHWTWVEAEHAIGGSGTTTSHDTSNVSGWWGTPNGYGQNATVTNMELAVTAPAAMSSDTKLYVRAALERDTNARISVDGVEAATLQWDSPGSSTHPTNFVQINDGSGEAGIGLGTLSQGDHTLEIRRSGGYLAWWRFDGVLVYDGTPVLPTETDYLGTSSGNRHWLPNPSSAASPVIGGPVTPTFNIDGLDPAHEVTYLLNGAVYTPGDEIGEGNHELVIRVLDGSGINGDRLAYSGANFTVIPEPATAGLVGAGLCLIFSRRRRA